MQPLVSPVALLACMAGVLFSLLALLACVVWQRWKARRNERTDAMFRAGAAYAYKRGWIAHGYAINQQNPRTDYPHERVEI